MDDHLREGRPSRAGQGGDESLANPSPPEPLLINEREAARLLSVSPRHLESLRRAGDVPHRRLGQRVLYSPAELRQWVDGGCLRADAGAGGEA